MRGKIAQLIRVGYLPVKVTITFKNHNKILNNFIFDKCDELNIVKIVFIIN